MAEMQYAVKIKMKYSGSYSVGPYNDRKEAEGIAADIAFGDVNTIKTQRGSTLYICTDPEAVEVVPFIRKDDRSGNGVIYDN